MSTPQTTTTTSKLEPLPTQEIVASEPVGVTPVKQELTASGAVQLDVDIKVPDGRAGMAPELSLVYRSSGDNGLVGVGWELAGFSSITRCPKIAALDGRPDATHFDATDRYCLDGQRLILVGGTYGYSGSEYRTEEETFVRVIAEGDPGKSVIDAWRVYYPDGRVARYGSSSASRFDGNWVSFASPTTPVAQVHESVRQAWLLDEVRDRSDNTIVYEYEKTADPADLQAYEMRPSRIVYTGHVLAPAQREVRFSYENRSDRIDRWTAGLHRRDTKRLSKIETYLSGSLVRRYTLHYETNSITRRSLLASLTECDGAGVCLPKTGFTWDLGSWEHDVIDTGITDVGVYFQSDYRLHVADVDGDGRDDVLYPDDHNNWWVRFSTGTGFGPRVTAGLPHIGDNIPMTVRIHDFDRDGKVDVLTYDCKTLTDCTSYAWALFQWNGVRFTRRYDTSFGSHESVSYGNEPFLLDLDGDGLADMLQPDSSGFHWYAQLFNGSAWSSLITTGIDRNPLTGDYRVFDHDSDGSSELLRRDPGPGGTQSFVGIARSRTGQWVNEPTNLPCTPNDNCASDEDYRQPDFNGDGLEDVVFPWAGDATTSVLNSRINSGQGFGPDRSGPADYVEPSHLLNSMLGGTSGVITEDMNNDGRDDLVFLFANAPTSGPGTGIEIYASTGDNFTRVDLLHSAGTPDPHGWSTTRTADVDGDGLRDILQIANGQLRVLRRRGGHPDLITAVSPLAVGTLMRFAYADIAKPGIHTRATNCFLPTRCAIHGVTVVTDAWLANGSGENHLSIRYGGGRRDLEGRGFVGFATRIVTDDARGLVTTSTYHNLPLSGYYTYAGHPQMVRDQYMLASGRRFDRIVTNLYSDNGALSSIHHAYLDHSTTQYFDRIGLPIPDLPFRTIEQSWSYDAYGNVTHSESQVVGGSSEVVDVGFDNRTVPWLLRLPTSATRTRCTSGTCVTQHNAASFDALGRLESSDRETAAAPATYRRTTIDQRDAFGNVLVMSAATTTETRSTTLSYDGESVYLDEVIDPLGHEHGVEIDPGLGVLTELVDPNGISQYLQYDGFGRVRGHMLQGQGATTIHYLVGTGHPLAIRRQTLGGDDVTTQLDALGRVVSETSHGLDGDAVVRDVGYDLIGNVASRSRRRFAGAPAQTSTFEHDGLGRLTRVAAADGTAQSVSYLPLETRRFDALGRMTRYVEDLDGSVSRVYEPDPDSPDDSIVTQYFQGPSGLDHVIDPLGNRTSFQYDNVGRRTYVEDGDRGGSTLAYDGFDELTTVTHADGASTVYDYDAGGRVRRIDSADGTTSLVWDTAANGIGLLAATTSATGIVTSFAYDSDSRPTDTTWDIDGETFTISRGYDGFGREKTLTYPLVSGTPPVVTENEYDGYGHLRSVSRGADKLWRATAADAEGHLTEATLGNGVIERRQFDPARGWLDTLTTLAPDGAALQRMTYDYDVAGKLQIATDQLTARSETFTYDRLDRLATWSVGHNGVTLRRTRFAYDHIGNLLGEDIELGPGNDIAYVVGASGFGPHQLNSGPDGDYGYDKRGRRITGPRQLVDFSDFDLPLRVENDGVVTTFKYDAFGRRVVKAADDEITTTLDGLYERRMPASGRAEHRFHVRAGTRSVADIVFDEASGDEQLRYLHADRLGSIAMTTDAAGQVVEHLRFDPWGRRVTDDDVPVPVDDLRRADVRQGFTGHTHDDELGLIDMRGRIYDPHTRRFLSGDPIVGEPLASQAWNPYSYVRNNPVNAVDPTGFFSTDIDIDLDLPGLDDKDDKDASEPDSEEEAPECVPAPEECPGGCSTPDEDVEPSSDQGVGDETSDSPEVPRMADDAPMSKNRPTSRNKRLPDWMNDAKEENARNGGKGVIYFLDQNDVYLMGERAAEQDQSANPIQLARDAGYTVVWIDGPITKKEFKAVIADDDTVGIVLDAHGREGGIRFEPLPADRLYPRQIRKVGKNLRFVFFVVCHITEKLAQWHKALEGVDLEYVYSIIGQTSWNDLDGEIEDTFRDNLDGIPDDYYWGMWLQ